MNILIAFISLTQLFAAELATVKKLEGQAFQVLSKKEVLLKVGEQLKPGTEIKVAHGSKVAFLLGNDVVTELRGGSVAVLKLRQGKDWTVDLKNGAVFSLVNNPLKRPEHFRVTTKSASMGVRGTGFFVKSEPGAPLFLCTCVGTVRVKDARGKLLKEITSRHHDEPVEISNGLKKAAMGEDHTDEQVTELSALFPH